MDKELRILILEDVPADVELQEHELRKSGLVFTSKVVDTRETFLKALDEFFPDLILSGYNLSSFDGLAALRVAKEKCPDVPFIVVTGKLGEEFAIEKIKEGATDYVLKNNLKRLVPVINRALEEAKQITEHKRLQDVMKLRLDLMEYAGTHSLEELLQKTLDEIGALTNSPIGFYHFVEPDQKTLSLQAWSTRTVKEFCIAKGKGMHYGIDKAGVWVDCVHERRPVIHNDYISLPHRKGLPEGHAAVIRELVVPIIHKDNVVAILGIGNKPIDYTEKDVELVSFIADVAWDITKRKQAEDELTRSNKDLKEFAYVVSHDLREPLQVIKGFLRLFEKRYKGKLDEKADQLIRFTIDGAERMQELIKDLLEYSKVGTKGKELKPTDCSLILNMAISNLKVAIEESGAVITQDTLPTVTADAAQLVRLFQNLIGNAIKFRSAEAPRIHISTERKEDEWLFSVRDNGIGIDPEFADRIFAVFQRLHSSGKYPGTGIGLAVCKKVVEHHGGRIWVESEPGKGATFYFTIPER
jgi:signal transduction histidine kinase/CheY-like chemotaxis protein